MQNLKRENAYFAYAPLGYKRHPEIKNTLTPG